MVFSTSDTVKYMLVLKKNLPDCPLVFLSEKIYKPQEYQGLKSKPGMWKQRREQHITMTPPSPMWTYGEKGDTAGGSGSCR